MFRSGSRDTSKYTLNLIIAKYYIVFAHYLSGNVISNVERLLFDKILSLFNRLKRFRG